MVKHHYLVLTWPEDPDDPTFNSELDWGISHPPECEYSRTADGWSGTWLCAVGFQIDSVGVEIFGPSSDREKFYSLVPTVIPVEFYADSFPTMDGTEWDVGIRLIDGVNWYKGNQHGGMAELG